MCAVPNMAVFCSSLIACFASTLLGYCLNVFEMVPVAPIFNFVITLNLLLSSFILNFKSMLAYYLLGGGLLVIPDRNKRLTRFTPALHE